MKITVVGAGKSGVAAALLAKKLGHSVFLTELNSNENYLNVISVLEENKIGFEFGGHSDGLLNETELVVASPGVPPTSEVLRSALIRRIPIISELEFASQQITNPIVAITGTNGKTTTTALTQYLFEVAGVRSVACGNIGVPLSEIVLNGIEETTWLIIETSSYQLDRITTFAPKIAVILNITPDHLTYHGSFEAYTLSKHSITKNQKRTDVLIVNDDNLVSIPKGMGEANVVSFSIENEPSFGMFADEKVLYFVEDGTRIHCLFKEELSLPGTHNCYNSMAAALIARSAGITVSNIAKGLKTFAGVEHRLEFVRELNGVRYINDSKATNVDSTKYALTSYSAPIIWIAGGRGDNNDYSMLNTSITKNVRCILAIGEEADEILTHFKDITSKKCSSFENAIQEAYKEAKAGEVVLFTPACKSFDMFKNYEERGTVYKLLVNAL